jgi:dihydroxyacetone kinase-like predicted kinase
LEKAILTKIQEIAVAKAKEDMFPDLIIKHKVLSEQGQSHLYSTVMKMIPLDTLIRALYIGYEVEQTEQEKLQEFLVNKGPVTNIAVEEVLRILGRGDLIPTLKEEN